MLFSNVRECGARRAEWNLHLHYQPAAHSAGFGESEVVEHLLLLTWASSSQGSRWLRSLRTTSMRATTPLGRELPQGLVAVVAAMSADDGSDWNAPLTDEQAAIFKKLRLIIYAVCVVCFSILLWFAMAPGGEVYRGLARIQGVGSTGRLVILTVIVVVALVIGWVMCSNIAKILCRQVRPS